MKTTEYNSIVSFIPKAAKLSFGKTMTKILEPVLSWRSSRVHDARRSILFLVYFPPFAIVTFFSIDSHVSL